jgi:hypothetical protein
MSYRFQEVYDESQNHKNAALQSEILRMIAVLKAIELTSGSSSSSGDAPTMQLFVRTKGEETITITLKASDTVELLKAEIFDRTSRLSHAGKPMVNQKVLSEYDVQPHTTLYEAPVVQAGAKVIKKALKKTDIVAATRKRFEMKLFTQYNLSDGFDMQPHKVIVEAISSVNEAVDKMKENHKSGEQAIKVAIHDLFDDELLNLSQLLAEKTSGEQQDGRLMTLGCHMYPEVNFIDELIDTLQKSKVHALSTFSEIVLMEFGQIKGDGVVLEMDKIRTVVDLEMRFRAGKNSNSGEAAIVSRRSRASCVIA